MIQVQKLKKTFKTYERGDSFGEVVKSLFVRKEKSMDALKEISFNIEKGELVGFLGPNGAGKSTTIKVLTGVLYPTSGEVDVMGYVPWRDRKRYVAKIGAVFGQKSQLLWDIPPLDAFRLNQQIYGIPDHVFKKNLNEMVELLEVSSIMKKQTRQLSLGERMKCEFIMALLHSPEIVFLDEPTIGLDLIAKEKIREFILEMNRKGVTFILTTHDMNDVEQLAKRVMVINAGEIVFDNSIAALSDNVSDKRLITLKTQRPIREFCMEGMEIADRPSDFEMNLELDTSRLELGRFIEHVNSRFIISDISIGKLPIESIIKQIYQSTAGKVPV